jgi:hypothetical protein
MVSICRGGSVFHVYNLYTAQAKVFHCTVQDCTLFTDPTKTAWSTPTRIRALKIFRPWTETQYCTVISLQRPDKNNFTQKAAIALS